MHYRTKIKIQRLKAANIAKQIADELFKNGAGDEAKRLVLELENGRDGGGWGKQVVINIIKEHLEVARVKEEG